MKVAITGVTGRLGGALVRHHRARGNEVLALDRESMDLADIDQVSGQLRLLEFDVLINPAAITGLEACEDDPRLAQIVNGEAPGVMAAECRRRAVPFIHVSTDYVFDGTGSRPLTESDSVRPVSVYGRTKRAGEEAVLRAYPGAWVTRVSWVFGPEKPGFIETMLGREARGEPLEAIDDKYSCPTFTDDIALAFDQLLALAEPPGGVVHVCNPGPVSWHGYACEIFRCRSGGKIPPIAPIPLVEMKAFRAPRPAHTAMSVQRLERLTGWRMRPWQEALREYLQRWS